MSRYAAIDIGSNSIRLLVAEVEPGPPIRDLESERQVVRLGASVFRGGKLGAVEMNAACQALARMAEHFRRREVLAVRAVGTAALRDASNKKVFLDRAGQILGTRVEVISGLEEARLIHLGVQSRWSQTGKRVLMVDIGGGSAELILSENGHLVEAFSKPLGALRLTGLFMKDSTNPIDVRELARMAKYIEERLIGPIARIGQAPLDRMIATSATASAAICAANGIRRSQREMADRMSATSAQIRILSEDLATRSLADRAKVTGIGPRRAEIIVAGIHVLSQIADRLRMRHVYYSAAGVRDGIIADLAARRVGTEQARLETDQKQVVRSISKRYGMNPAHVRKVSELAASLFDGLRSLHGLAPAQSRLLEAAAYLYNIGHFVNEARHHRHSMYLVANSDLPGFAARERLVVANLCRYHRKSMPSLAHEPFEALSPDDQRVVVLLTPLLRLAVALDQSQEQRVVRVDPVWDGRAVELRLSTDQDVDIEQWHASQVAAQFRQVYGVGFTVKVRRTSSA
ncbi:MAG: Ppx/GppA phosphatase family protein [Acidobacteriota bacterium]